MRPSIVVTGDNTMQNMHSRVNDAFLADEADDEWAVGGMDSPTFSLDDVCISPPPSDRAVGWTTGYMSTGSAEPPPVGDQPGLFVPRIRVGGRPAVSAVGSAVQTAVADQVRSLVRRFTMRTNRVKSALQDSPSSSFDDESEDDDVVEPPTLRVPPPPEAPPLPAPEPAPPPPPPPPAEYVDAPTPRVKRAGGCCAAFACFRAYCVNRAINPQGAMYLVWLSIISAFFTYNSWAIPLRAAFPFHNAETSKYWYTFDYMGDLLYLLDIILFKSRVMFVRNGFWVKNPPEIRQHYASQPIFFLDVLSLVPFDIFYFSYGHQPLLRLNRLLKIQTYWKFMDRVDALLAMPHYVRTIRTVIYMLLLIHVNACAYYAVSVWEGIATNGWVFDGVGNPYVRCFYFATKTATSIGKNPKPTNEFEYVFMTGSWLMGVFVFALLIGQIRDIVAKITRSQDEFRQLMDNTMHYMQHLSLPPELQHRVRTWMHYTWRQQKSLDELKALEVLPHKMQTDIALSVHSDTLKKVHLFQNCDEALLRDLVLKLKPINYLPGDYVCKKGEVGREMYIVKSGHVMVMSGRSVLATLQQGSVFGEISLLGLDGLSRRTADVRSRGYSTLFALNKTDLQESMRYYPDAQELLRKRAKTLIKKNEAMDKVKNGEPENDDVIIKARRPSTPKLLHAVLQVVDPSSLTASMLGGRGARGARSQLELRVPSSLSASRYSPMSLPPQLDNTRASFSVETSDSLTEEDERERLMSQILMETRSPQPGGSARPPLLRYQSEDHGDGVIITKPLRNWAGASIDTTGTLSLDSDWGRRLSRQAAVQSEMEMTGGHPLRHTTSRQSTPPTPGSGSGRTNGAATLSTPAGAGAGAGAGAAATALTASSAGHGAAGTPPGGARSARWRHNRVSAQSSVVLCSAMVHRERTPTSPGVEGAGGPATATERF